MWWHWAIGYTFSTIFGAVLIYRLNQQLYKGLGWKPGQAEDELHPQPYHPAMVGVVERSLYTASWQLGKPEFIGIWLVLKVAGQWGGWSEDRKVGEKRVLGRAVYNVFLIGNAFSLAYGVVGALMAEWIRTREYDLAVAIPFVLLVATGIFTLWARLENARR